ncbi:MAG: hypothetical protein J1G02_04570 [Clostridiales bacterium]|nr:hypothetical protein [Clostridiales bacterium]
MVTKRYLKTTLLVLCIVAFVTSVALLGLCFASETNAEQQVFKDVTVRVDNGIRVDYTVNLPEGYTAPSLQIERGSQTVTLTSYVKTAEGIVFTYGGVRAAVMDQEITATLYANNASGEKVSVEENTFTVSDYFNTLLAKTAEESGITNNFVYQAQRAYAANILNLGEKATGNSLLSLSSDERKLIVFTDENKYNGSDWPLRDSLTKIEGTDATGFAWVGLPVFDLNQGFYLRYSFTATNAIASDLRVKIDLQDNTHWTIPVQIGEQNGVPVYGFGYGVDATEFCFDAQVTVYSGDTPISATIGYSMNRALAYGATFGDRDTRALASAAWSLGKAVVWYEYAEEMDYVFLPNMTDNGIYAGFMFDYVYDSNLMIAESMGKSNPAIWLNGTGYSAEELSDTTVEDGYTVAYEQDLFTVTLDGVGDVSGIVVPSGDLRIAVNADSSVSGGFYRNWDDKNSRTVSTVGTTENITIVGSNGSTLTVNGRLLTDGNVTVEGNVNVVVVIDKSDMNGLEAHTLTVSDGAKLTLRYVGTEPARNAGIRTISDISVVDAQLDINSFMYGIQFGGDQDNREIDFTVTNSVISIVSDDYGVTAVEIPGADWNGWQATRWTVTLALSQGSKMNIDGGRGTRFVNIVLGNAALTVNAIYNGIGDEWTPATLTTTSGNYEVGTLTVTVANTNTGAYAMVASAMDLNGGTITFVSGNMEGVLKTTNRSVWNLENCDVFVKTTSVSKPVTDWEGNVSIARTWGINAQSGGEQINIDTSARLIVQDCDIAFACWVDTAWSPDPPVAVKVLGYLQIDNFFVPQWDWGLTAQFSDGEGNPVNIIYTNQRFE